MEVHSKDVEQCAANERQIGQEIGIAGTRLIFAHQHVAPPVIADFNPTPMPANQLQPLFGPILCGRCAREVITGFGRAEPVFFEGPFTAQDDQGSGKGEVALERFDGKGVPVPGFDAPMARLGLGKKGVSCKASKPCACLSKLGWLPLIWNR